jgi:hypothetical protein
VKVVVVPLAGLIVPSVVLVRAHAYVIPDGQVALQVGVAVKSVPLLAFTVGEAGVTATEERVADPWKV